MPTERLSLPEARKIFADSSASFRAAVKRRYDATIKARGAEAPADLDSAFAAAVSAEWNDMVVI